MIEVNLSSEESTIQQAQSEVSFGDGFRIWDKSKRKTIVHSNLPELFHLNEQKVDKSTKMITRSNTELMLEHNL